MRKWAERQFIDKFRQKPEQFVLEDPGGEEESKTCEMKFVPGKVAKIGTFTNRGYFQPIESFFTEYGKNGVRAMLSRARQSLAEMVNRVRKRIMSISSTTGSVENHVATGEHNLSRYAPKTGAVFSNPKANSPSATDNSTRIATTAQVRAFVGQYAFPPKNIPVKQAISRDNELEVRWKDPSDFSYNGMLLSKWSGTKVVFRTDRYPNNEKDGTLLIDNKIRNAFASTGVKITDSQTLAKYYFGLFPYSDKGVYNRHTANQQTGKINYIRTTLASLSAGRALVASGTDGNGNVVFAGGISANFSAYWDTVEKYSLSGARTILTPLSIRRYGMASATDGSGDLIFAGGYGSLESGSLISRYKDIVEKYTKDGLRTTLTPLNERKINARAASDGDGNVIVAGGLTVSGSSLVSTAAVERYSTDGTKIELSPLSVARNSGAAAMDGAGNAVFAGGAIDAGTGNAPHSNRVDRYAPSGVRTTLAPLSVAKSGCYAERNRQGDVIVAGGRTSDGKASDTVDRYTKDGARTTMPALQYYNNGQGIALDGYGNIVFSASPKGGGVGAGLVARYSENGGQALLPDMQEYRSSANVRKDGNGNVLFAGGVQGTVDKATVEKYTINI